jgi:hypothetical protein
MPCIKNNPQKIVKNVYLKIKRIKFTSFVLMKILLESKLRKETLLRFTVNKFITLFARIPQDFLAVNSKNIK